MHFVLHSQQFEPSKKDLTEVLARQLKLLCFAVPFGLSYDFMMTIVLISSKLFVVEQYFRIKEKSVKSFPF